MPANSAAHQKAAGTALAVKRKEASPSSLASAEKDLTPEQDYRARVMGEEELELLRAAASHGGLQLAYLNWILASLVNHGFVSISGSDQHLRAIATEAGYLAVARRPLLPDDTPRLH
jgi:hypothetical protein